MSKGKQGPRHLRKCHSQHFGFRISTEIDELRRLLAEEQRLRREDRERTSETSLPILQCRFSRGYHYQRAGCDDPEIIRKWLNLVRNIIGKYGVAEGDIFNFGETGFVMGLTATAKVITRCEFSGRPPSGLQLREKALPYQMPCSYQV